MKKTVVSLLLAVVASVPLVQAQPQAQTVAPVADLDATTERARIERERAALERRALTERKDCYRKFAVNGCLTDSARRQRLESDQLRQQESVLNGVERKRRGADQLERLEEAQKKRVNETRQQVESARESQQQREDRAAEHTTARDAAAASVPVNAAQFERRQRAFAEQQAEAARRRAQAPAERERYEQKIQEAAQRQAEHDKKNAEGIKSRAAGLPAPP
ncbi:MAG: hypothetical protein JWQ03_685 [Variovorax sp.]|nr:hypothetical protein [Variovorax sp.]